MKQRALLQGISSVGTAMGINTIPVGIVLWGGGSTETVMVLYLLETVLLIILSALRVRLLAPLNDEAYTKMVSSSFEIKNKGRVVRRGYHPRNRDTLINTYLLITLSLSVVLGVFLFFFFFLLKHAEISGSVILTGLKGIIAFQLIGFVADLFLLRPLPAQRIEGLLQQSLGRVALLYFAIFIGMLLAFMVNSPFLFIWPFAILKTITDIAAPIQAVREQFRGA